MSDHDLDRQSAGLGTVWLEKAIQGAFLRGIEWLDENPMDREYKFKAAEDYADKAIAALEPAGEAVATGVFRNGEMIGFVGLGEEFRLPDDTDDRRPLYTHPAPAVPDAVEALRDCLDRFVEAFPAAKDYPPIRRGYEALSALAASHMPVGDGYEPYLWQCKDYADGWITYTDREEALAYQRDTGCLLRITYRPPAASTGEARR